MALSLTPEERRLRARVAANTRWSREDPAEQANKMRGGFRRKFEREVDPNGELPQVERERRARAALRAHMARLALKSSRARSKSKAGT